MTTQIFNDRPVAKTNVTLKDLLLRCAKDRVRPVPGKYPGGLRVLSYAGETAADDPRSLDDDGKLLYGLLVGSLNTEDLSPIAAYMPVDLAVRLGLRRPVEAMPRNIAQAQTLFVEPPAMPALGRAKWKFLHVPSIFRLPGDEPPVPEPAPAAWEPYPDDTPEPMFRVGDWVQVVDNPVQREAWPKFMEQMETFIGKRLRIMFAFHGGPNGNNWCFHLFDTGWPVHGYSFAQRWLKPASGVSRIAEGC